MREDGYESDKNQLLVIPDIKRPGWINHFFNSADGKGTWDLSPGSISWSKDAKTLYLVAETQGRTAIFSTPSNVMQANKGLPAQLLSSGTIADIQPLANGQIFISGSSLIDNSAYSLFDPSSTKSQTRLISSSSKSGSAFGLSRNQVDEIWFKGVEADIHAWVFKPSNFKKGEKYPLAYLIHGGPQGAWNDGWSTRWNPAVFAEQGFVVIAPVSTERPLYANVFENNFLTMEQNPTGSTGYGQDLTDGIQEQWGGLPYQDLVKGFEYIEESLDYVDTGVYTDLA